MPIAHSTANWCGLIHLNQIKALRQAGMPCCEIGQRAYVSDQGVRSFCHRHRLVGNHGGARHKGRGTAFNGCRVVRKGRTLFVYISALIVCCLGNIQAMEWTYDKQLHLVAGGAAGYVMSDVLERTTGLNACQRFLVTTATVTVAAYAHEELIGVNDPEDAQASTLGGILGAGGQLGASLLLSEKQASLSVAWSF